MFYSGSEIRSVVAREILDSRGNPTVECEVTLESGAKGIASVPSGASTGEYEAYEKRDGGKRYIGRGVLSAIDSVNNIIFPALSGVSAIDSERADSIMIALDGTHNKSNLGANAILSVSLAVCRAAADHFGMPLYRYLGGIVANGLPYPMMNVLNGGAHSNNGLDFQEFMIVPKGGDNFAECVRMGAEIFHSLGAELSDMGLSRAVGDEGGYAPNIPSEKDALDLILKAIKRAGYRAGEDVFLALDVAASEWHKRDEDVYFLPKSGRYIKKTDLLALIEDLVSNYPIISVEDAMGENDTEGWRMLTKSKTLKGIMLVGDDLFVTNKKRLAMGVKEGIANSILIKPNQIGTVSETISTVTYAKTSGYKTIMSHRSGETADTFIADLAVGLGTDYIKTGSLSRSERVEKYNRLMKIESELFAPGFSGN